MRLANSKGGPKNKSNEMTFFPQKKQSRKEWKDIAKCELHRVRILSRDTHRLDELMVLLVEPLVQWEVPALAVKEPMHEVEAEVLTHK